VGENDSDFRGSSTERSDYLIIRVFEVWWCFSGRTRVALVVSENRL